MSFFNEYPYRNLTDLNLDYILKVMGKLVDEVENFVSLNAIKYADPIQWNITKQYEKNTIVIDPNSGTAYISVKPVPSGVQIVNTDYWTVVFDLSTFVTRSNKNFTERVEPEGVIYATMHTLKGQWVVWESNLYIALADINVNDAYAININIRRARVEDVIGNFEDLETEIKTNIVAAINETVENLNAEVSARTEADTTLQTAIDEEAAARQTAISDEAAARSEADSALQTAISDEATTRAEADTTLQTAIDNETTARTAADTAIQGAITNIEGDIADIEARIGDIAARRYIFISDSYGTVANDWITALVSIMHLSNNDYFKSAVNGSGFAANTTFKQQLTALAGSISDKNSITDIVVGGGFNDRAVQTTTVETAIQDFITYAKTTFPKAKIHIGFIGWAFNSEFISELIVNNVIGTYKKCPQWGANYIDKSDLVLHGSSLFLQEEQSPYVLYLGYKYMHPNAAGGQAIANCIANYLLSGSGVVPDYRVSVDPTLSTGVAMQSGELTLNMHKNGANVVVNTKSYGLKVINFTTPQNLNNSPIELGQLDSGLIAGVNTVNQNTKAEAFLVVSGFALYGSLNHSFTGYLMIANNRIYLLAYLDGATSVSTIGIYGASALLDVSSV